MNVVVELQRRQWSPVELWNTNFLDRFYEDSSIQRMAKQTIKTTMQQLVTDRQSTMVIAFSCNGEYVASGHHTHEIVVCCTTPNIHYWRTLVGHKRTPWVLTFDPNNSHLLYSGCLAGIVLKWNLQDDGGYECSFDSGIQSPINAITFIPSDSQIVIVAVNCWLFLLLTSNFGVIWQVQISFIVRSVLHHPEQSKILTAIANVTPVHQGISKTSYRLQVHSYNRNHPPDLRNSDVGFVCSMVQVFSSSKSCAMTTNYVICTCFQKHSPSVSVNVYSILPETFGELLYTFTPGQANYSVLNIELSPCEGYLLLGVAPKKGVMHMNRMNKGAKNAIIYKLCLQSSSKPSQQLVFDIETKPNVSSNMALWMPLTAGHGYGVCMGTQQGDVFLWRLTEPCDENCPIYSVITQIQTT